MKRLSMKFGFFTLVCVLAWGTSAGAADFAVVQAEIRRMPGLERHYTFEDGKWHMVANKAPVFPGECSMDGGPLGSLSIKSASVYGLDYDGYDLDLKGTPCVLQPHWTDGRIAGKSALSLGLRPDTTYRSGLTGDEFQKGWSFVLWTKVESPTGEADWAGRAPLLSLGDAWKSGFSLVSWKGKGKAASVELRLALPHRDGTANVLALRTPGVVASGWHCLAATWDGAAVRLYVDGVRRAETNGVAQSFVPVKFPCTWSGNSPFDESVMRAACFRLGGVNPQAVVTFDELAVFSRALREDELKTFLKVPAEVQVPKPDGRGVRLAIPHDSNGYFRIDGTVPATCDATACPDVPPGAKLRVTVETLAGLPVSTAEVPLSDGRAQVDVKFPACGVYYVDLALADADGQVLKTLGEPYPVGIVPPAPKTLDSPFALWATEDAFHYDMNVRRIFLWYPWKADADCSMTMEKWKALDRFKRSIRLFREKQKLGDQLRLFMCFTLKTGPKTSFTEEEKKVLRHGFELQVAAAKEAGVKDFEVTSEVNKRLSPEGYVEQLKILVPIVRREIPDAKIYPPGATPDHVSYIDRLLKFGANELVDGVSIHAYNGSPIWNYHWKSLGKKLLDVCRAHAVGGKALPIYNTESGVFCLPRVNGRPMTRDIAARTRMRRIASPSGYQGWCTSMIIVPEDEAAALQCTTAMMDFATGFELYCKCQHGLRGSVPSLQGVAMTALSGQVLNHAKTHPRVLELPTLEAAALVFDRPSEPERHVLAAFADKPMRLTFRVPPHARFKTMDLYGNFGRTAADGHGVLTLDLKAMAPAYVFGVPGEIAAVSPMKMTFPSELPDGGCAMGAVEIENPFTSPLRGTLSVRPIPGCEIALEETTVNLAPGERRRVALRFVGKRLKRKPYSLRVDLGDIASAESVFASKGVVTAIPEAVSELPLDGDPAKWRAYPAEVADDAESVSLGKPNPAEPWVPQWTNPKDHSFSLRTAYVRGEAIRFLLNVTDDRLVTVPASDSGRPFLYDCVELFVDTRGGRELGRPAATGADQVVVVPTAGDRAEPCRIWYPKGENRRIDVSCVGRRTPDGFLIEGEIRPRAGSAFRVQPGSPLRLDVLVDDCDDAARPRKSAMALHGTVDNMARVEDWGRYELAPPQ